MRLLNADKSDVKPCVENTFATMMSETNGIMASTVRTLDRLLQVTTSDTYDQSGTLPMSLHVGAAE